MVDKTHIQWTEEALKALKFRGPVAHYSYAKGGARHDYVAVDEPRFGYFWKLETRHGRERQAYMVDGDEVATLAEAVEKLSMPPAADSRDELKKAWLAEIDASPRLDYGATRAISESGIVHRSGPFGLVRAWIDRAGNAFHQGINAYANALKKDLLEFPHWLYAVNTAAHESSRGMLLFRQDRQEDTDLKCTLGKACRTCPILSAIESRMVEAGAEVEDIDAAKVWTCIGHILKAGPDFVDGAFFSRKEDRDWHA